MVHKSGIFFLCLHVVAVSDKLILYSEQTDFPFIFRHVCPCEGNRCVCWRALCQMTQLKRAQRTPPWHTHTHTRWRNFGPSNLKVINSCNKWRNLLTTACRNSSAAQQEVWPRSRSPAVRSEWGSHVFLYVEILHLQLGELKSITIFHVLPFSINRTGKATSAH